MVQTLQQLEKLEVLSYLPKSDKPQLQFLLPRSDAAHLHIDHAYIAQRKEVRYGQLQAVKDYLDPRNCRSNTLLQYFGETPAAACGTCDVCLRKKKKSDEADLPALMQTDLAEILAAGPETLDRLVNRMKHGSEEERIALIRQLLDEGKLKINNGRYYL